MITKEIKLDVINKFKINAKDTGSVEVQIALLTERINRLNGLHFKANPKDQGSKRGLLKLVGHRRSLLDYLSDYNKDKYEEVIARLQLRK